MGPPVALVRVAAGEGTQPGRSSPSGDLDLCQLYYTQARNLLVHGSNRREGHEIWTASTRIYFPLANGKEWLPSDLSRIDLLIYDTNIDLADSEYYV